MIHKGFLFIGSLVVALLMVEGAMRLAFPLGDSHYHPTFHHRLHPHTDYPEQTDEFDVVMRTNNLGLRGSRDYGVKSVDTQRLLILGDSFMMAVGVEEYETVSGVLQSAYPELEVLNAGVSSYSTILHYVTLRDLYLPLGIDGVMLWFDFSDLQDDYFYEPHLLYDAIGQIVGCNARMTDGRFDLVNNIGGRTATGKFLHDRFRGMYHRLTPTETQHDDRYLILRGKEFRDEVLTHWERSSRYLVMIRDLLRDQGIPFVLVLYPYGVQVGPHQWGEGRIPYGFEPGITYYDPFPFDLIESFANDAGIPTINVMSSFVAANHETLFYPWDGHFTVRGNQVAVEHLRTDPVFRAFRLAMH